MRRVFFAAMASASTICEYPPRTSRLYISIESVDSSRSARNAISTPCGAWESTFNGCGARREQPADGGCFGAILDVINSRIVSRYLSPISWGFASN